MLFWRRRKRVSRWWLKKRGEGGGEMCRLRFPVRLFSKHTSKAESATEVNAMRVSPTMSLGLPYSLSMVSLI